MIIIRTRASHPFPGLACSPLWSRHSAHARVELEVTVKGSASLPKLLRQLAGGPERRASGTAGDAAERFAFAAIIRDGGAMVARVVADRDIFWPQNIYGYFASWTEAQNFATLLNQVNGIDTMEAQQIIVGVMLGHRRLERIH